MPFAAAISTALDARQAVDEVCWEASRQMGDARPELALAFYSPHHADSAGPIARLLHGKLQPRCLIGCLGESIVGNRREVEGDPALSLWLGNWNGRVEVDAFQLQMSQTSDGVTLLGWPDAMLEIDPAKSLLLAFGDPYTFPTAEIFLPTLNDDYPGLVIAGGMASSPSGPSANSLILNDEVIAEGAVGVLLHGKFGYRNVVSQGCRPIGRPMIVTKGQENIIIELGGRQPLEYLQGLYSELTPQDRTLCERGLLLGVAINEYRDEFRQGDFLIRNLLGIDRNTGVMAITDRIRVGQTVQFQVRDGASADACLRTMLKAENDSGLKAKGGLLFTCNGRGTRMFTDASHDAGAIQEVVGPLPLAGFFAAGELGPVGGKNFIHGFTASAVFFE
ncbi:MAG: FIST C-terminal domain-containing protein [Planctomycetes bacterium]|nr:FIST C-terminal domain-containing protein [Planctomycetota bacterium]